ncbi:MAG: hypothetical protein K2Y01_00925 [Rhabdochlamydiaceae bacterium]|nr:hypothetical protein [Rhabdochlamydiaceae bacterium]
MSNGSIPPNKLSTDDMIRSADKQAIIPHSYEAPAILTKSGGSGGEGELSNSPWAKMFPLGATKDELRQFINTFMKDLISQMNHQDEIHKKHMQEIKAIIEEG